MARSALEIFVPLVAGYEDAYHQLLGLWNVTLVSLVQLRNADLPIEVTPFPIITLLSNPQLENAESPIEITLFGIVILVKEQ